MNLTLPKYSCRSLYEYIHFFISIQDLDLSLNEYKIREISDLRNSIVHDDIKNSLIYKHTNNTKSYNKNSPTSLYKDHICYFIEILDLYNTCIQSIYSSSKKQEYAHKSSFSSSFNSLSPLIMLNNI